MEFLEILAIIFVSIVGLIGCMVAYMVISRHVRPIKEENSQPLDLKKITTRHQEEIQYVEGSQKVTIANLREQVASLTTRNSNLSKKMEKINQSVIDDVTIEENSVEHLQANYDIDPVKAAEYMKKIGLNPNVLTNPALAEEGWKRLNENKLVAMAAGVLVPKGQVGPVTPLTDIFKKNGDGQDSSIDPIDAIVENMEQVG